MVDCATVVVAFTAPATLGGFDALATPDATTTDADTAHHVATPCVSATSAAASADALADAHATANDVSIAPAIATLGSNARGTKRKASDDASENLQKPWGQRPARVRLLVKQHSSIYHAPCEQ